MAAALAVLAAGSLAAGAHLLTRPPTVTAADTGAVPAAAVSPAQSPTPTRMKPAPRTPAGVPAAPPVRIVLPRAGVTAPVVAVGVRPDGELTVPDSPAQVGWWVGSAPAGSADGSTVLAGHVDSAREGRGAFAVLRTVAVGDRVELVDTFGGRHAYRIAARRSYPKYALPADVFTVAGPPRLVLLTCGGPFDRAASRYRDNIAVYALPA